MGFYHRLHGLGNNIWQAESLALGVTPQDSVLCVTAGEDRPLHVLLDNPRRVLAIDSNAQRNALLERKIQALRSEQQHVLHQTSCDYIKQRVDRIEIVTANVLSHLRSCSDRFDVFCLSDMAAEMA